MYRARIPQFGQYPIPLAEGGGSYPRTAAAAVPLSIPVCFPPIRSHGQAGSLRQAEPSGRLPLFPLNDQIQYARMLVRHAVDLRDYRQHAAQVLLFFVIQIHVQALQVCSVFVLKAWR